MMSRRDDEWCGWVNRRPEALSVSGNLVKFSQVKCNIFWFSWFGLISFFLVLNSFTLFSV